MDIVKNSVKYIAISWVMFFLSLGILLFGKLNLWIDMTGGIQMDYDYQKWVNIEQANQEISQEAEKILHNESKVINDTSLYKITGEDSLSVVIGFYDIASWISDQEELRATEKKLEEYKNEIRSQTLSILQTQDETISESKYQNIWKSFWDYIKNTAFLTLGIAIIAIAIYVMHAFSWAVSGINVYSFAIITIVTLFHDVIISTGLYIFTSLYYSDFQIDTFFITALLTILGYSINDTIVVFDRIRDNLRKFAGKKGKDEKDLYEIVNMSINETVVRSIYTSATLLFVLITIFFFGPETISGFVLVMIFGTIVGTYSSIFIASPLFYMVNKNKKLTIYKKKVVNPDDKIVV